MNEAAEGNRGFISDLRSRFNLEDLEWSRSGSAVGSRRARLPLHAAPGVGIISMVRLRETVSCLCPSRRVSPHYVRSCCENDMRLVPGG